MDLKLMARQGANAKALIEKAVDVSIAVDMVVMAERDEYDAVYLLSADGDFTPAVDAVKQHNKKVYGVSPSFGSKLSSAVDSYIQPPRDWFMDCYR